MTFKRKILSGVTAIAAVAGFGLATPAMAQGAGDDYAYGFSGGAAWTLTINGTDTFTSVDTGWINSVGEHSTGNNNYIVGTCCFGSGLEYNNWVSFDLSSLSGPVTSAAVTINSFDVFLTVPRTYTIWDTSASLSQLDANRNPGDAGGIGLHLDLQSGTSYASYLFTPSTPDNTPLTFDFNSAGIAALNGSAGGNFAFGGSMNIPNIGPDVPEPDVWALLILGFGAVGGAMRRRGAKVGKAALA